jgi:arylsulfatase A-like enzyme
VWRQIERRLRMRNGSRSVGAITVRGVALVVCLLTGAGALGGCASATRPPKFRVATAEDRSSSAAAERLRAGAQNANLIIIMLDAARPDHYGFFGYERNTTPHEDKLLSSSVVFSEAYATASNTNTSTASLYTSQFPDTHGVVGVMTPLTEEAPTLSECMKGAGCRTAAFIANAAVSDCFGFARGFDEYNHVARQAKKLAPGLAIGKGRVDARLMLENAIPWFKEHEEERFFAFLHFLEPHDPYTPPLPYSEMFFDEPSAWRNRTMTMYDGNLAYVDHMLGKMFGELDDTGLLDKSVIVLLADHGEAFGEHGHWAHESTVYQEMIRVPLAFHLPPECGAAAQVRSEVICLTDVMPTLLDLFGIEPPKTMQGRSRLALLAGESETEPGLAVSRARGNDKTGGRKRPFALSYALTVPGYTLILAEEGKRVELYDRQEDPTQQEDVAADRPDLLAELRLQFQEWVDTQRVTPVVLPGGRVYTSSTREVELDEVTRKQLEALGYLK